MGTAKSPPLIISPSSISNVMILRGTGRPKVKKKSLSSSVVNGFKDEDIFRDILVTFALDRVLTAINPKVVAP